MTKQMKLVLSLSVFAILIPGTVSQQPLICGPHTSKTYYWRPSSPDCGISKPGLDELFISQPKKAVVHIYKKNEIVHDTVANLCRIIETKSEYYSNFYNSLFVKKTTRNLWVPEEICEEMVYFKDCSMGLPRKEMENVDGILETNNTHVIDPPTPIFGCCRQHVHVTVDCLVVPTRIIVRPGKKFPESPGGDMSNCNYKSGSCKLADKSRMMWNPEKEEACPFLKVQTVSGTVLGNVFTSDNFDIVLSWNNTRPLLESCGVELTLTDQGFGVVIEHQPSHQLQIENEVQSAELDIFQSTVNKIISDSFFEKAALICQRKRESNLAEHFASLISPTNFIRHLYSRHNIIARNVGDELIEVEACTPLPDNKYRLVAFDQNECYQNPRINVMLRQGTIWKAFLDLSTLQVVAEAERASCDNIPRILQLVNNSFAETTKSNDSSGVFSSLDLWNWFSSSVYGRIERGAKWNKETSLGHLRSEISCFQTFFDRITLFDFWCYICLSYTTLSFIVIFYKIYCCLKDNHIDHPAPTAPLNDATADSKV